MQTLAQTDLQTKQLGSSDLQISRIGGRNCDRLDAQTPSHHGCNCWSQKHQTG